MNDENSGQERNARNDLIKFTLISLMILFGIILIRKAWLAEDAFITIRTVDNFVNGFGLRYNLDERVQAYTHPLWMFAISFFYYFTREPFYTVIFLSLIITLISVLLIPTKISKSVGMAMIGIIFLVFSNSFVDYSTSGLENPLSYLIAALFFAIYFRYTYSLKHFFLLSFLTSIAGFNRLDLLLLFIPSLLYVFIKIPKKRSALFFLFLGQLPLIFWELFSLVYYGFLFPNTYYAKLFTFIPQKELLFQGFLYCIESITNDPITLCTILLVSIWFISPFQIRKDASKAAAVIGIFFYIIAVLLSGGDFMAGRFFSVPFFVAVLLLTQVEFPQTFVEYKIVLLGLPLLLGFVATIQTYSLAGSPNISQNGIANERVFYSSENGLINQSRSHSIPFNNWVYEGNSINQLSQTADSRYITAQLNVGMIGYYSGPNAHLVDRLALSDAFLSHLPALYNPIWRIGHFEREIPQGYLESLNTGKDLIIDPDLKRLYKSIQLITRGDLFDPIRLRLIYEINTGAYEPNIDIEKHQFSRALQIKETDLKITPIDANSPITFIPAPGGLQIFLEKTSFANILHFGIEADDKYEIWVYRTGTVIYKGQLLPTGFGLQEKSFQIPVGIATQGYDSLRVIPASMSDSYNISYISYIK